MNISFFQYTPLFLDIEQNLQILEKMLECNISQIKESEMVIFPEYFLSGSIDLLHFPQYKELCHRIRPRERLIQISRNYPTITFVMGSLLDIEGDDGKVYNRSLVIRDGLIITQYNKKALIYNENHICTSDSSTAIFQVGEYRFGLAICWDMILPEVFRHYTSQVDCMIVPSFWGIGGNALQVKYPFSLEKKYYASLGVARAYENAFSLLFVNSVGSYSSPFYSDRMMGGSYLVDPPFGITYQTNQKDPNCCHTVILEKKNIEQYREYYATDTDYFYYQNKGFI